VGPAFGGAHGRRQCWRYWFLPWLLLLLLGTGCQVHVVAGIDAGRGGAGVVSAGVGLDDDALGRVGDLGRQLAVDDLRRAGWAVGEPKREGDGLTWVRARRSFANPAQAERLLASLSDPAGPFRALRLSHRSGVFRDRLSLSGVLDFSAGPGAFFDSGLRSLVGPDLHLDDPALRQGLKSELHVRLGGTGRVYRASVGQRVIVRMAADSWDVAGLALVAAAVACAVVAVAALLLGRRS
jgi:hypothetical protein